MPSVIMPKMGDAMEEGTLLRWLKQVGEDVAAGDPIAEIETDKVSLEIEANEAGTLTKVLVEEGQTVPIGTAIATIGDEADAGGASTASAATAEIDEAPGETPYEEGAPFGVQDSVESNGREAAARSASAPAPAPAAATGNGVAAEAPQPVAASQAPAAPAAPASQPAPAVPQAGGAEAGARDGGQGERLRASPLVKRLAAEHGIDLSGISGTGPGGRIIRDDIAGLLTGAPAQPAAPATGDGAAPAPAPAAPAEQAAAAPAPAPAPVAAPAAAAGRPQGTVRELSRIRRTTGKRMAESKQTAPHFYVTVEVDMGPAVAFREQANAQVGDEATKVSFNDLIVKAAALALRDFPNLNASYENDALVEHPNIDVNVAVAIDGGLIAPYVPDAADKSLGAIARMTKDLIGRAREGGLQPAEYQGGTFTVSNLGMFAVEEFIGVINPPQAAILAVASIKEVPVVEDGAVVPGRRMNLTLSADHRVTDGAEVARFLAAVKRLLENPMRLLLS